MLQQAVDFLEESEALDRLVSTLDEGELSRETQFKRWPITQIIGHLHVWNWAADASLADSEKFNGFVKQMQDFFKANKGATIGDFEKDWLARQGAAQGMALIDAWRDGYRATADHFKQADPKRRVLWVGPEMSARSSITARQMESWAHGQAIFDILGVKRENTDRIKNIVVLGVHTYGWTFRVRGLEPPEPIPYLCLRAPSGEMWHWHEANEEEYIKGEAEAFCQVVTQTRHIADTGLEVHGKNAEAWMSQAQCFAGQAETPPAPGSRFRVGTKS